MSVVDLSKHGDLSEFLEGMMPEACFYCAQPILPGPIVLWNGSAVIALHWQCAITFAAHLGHDAIHAKTIERNPQHLPMGIDSSVKP